MEDDKDIPRKYNYEECYISINYSSIDSVISTLTAWKEEHPEAINPSLDINGDNDISIAYHVAETDEEYTRRLETTRKRNADELKRKRACEYNEYLRLKKQFESLDQNNIVGQNLQGEK